MTERQLLKRFQYWMEELFGLGLAHHEVTMTIVDQIDENPDYLAQVHISDDYDSFTVLAKREWADESSPKDLDRVIIHELCHVPVHKLMRAARLAELHMSPSAANIWYRQLDHEMEGVVERFARALHDAYV
jgi:hypothetical protein